MKPKYNIYVKKSVRKVLLRSSVSASEKQSILDNYKYPEQLIIEEVLDVKNIGSFPGLGKNNFITSGRKISEDTNRELSITDTDNSESSPECDNQCDKPITI